MNQLITITRLKFLVVAFLLILIQIIPVTNVKVSGTVSSAAQSHYAVYGHKLDQRAQILSDYLSLHNSPLQYQAQTFIEAADTYGVDWKLVTAISGVESTFGKFTPGGFNAWGWGVYGDHAQGFKSWKEAIFTITAGLRENYINKGYTEPYTMNTIYAASPYWGWKVNYFLHEIDQFSQKYPLNQSTNPVIAVNGLSKTAGASAAIASN